MKDDREPKIRTWRELIEQTIELGLGAALLTKETATKLVDDLVKRGDMTRDEGRKLVDTMLEKGKGQKERMESFVSDVVERALSRTDVARRSIVDDLERRIAELERRLPAEKKNE
jgi:polyhydroxyalkanoate synthesis regulator phasin